MPLGLEKIYVQAKRYTTGSVGEPEIRNFSGSLDAHGAERCVHHHFHVQQHSSPNRPDHIGRQQVNPLSRRRRVSVWLMIRHGVGVVTEYTYEIKKLDENYFAEEI